MYSENFLFPHFRLLKSDYGRKTKPQIYAIAQHFDNNYHHHHNEADMKMSNTHTHTHARAQQVKALCQICLY